MNTGASKEEGTPGKPVGYGGAGLNPRESGDAITVDTAGNGRREGKIDEDNLCLEIKLCPQKRCPYPPLLKKYAAESPIRR